MFEITYRENASLGEAVNSIIETHNGIYDFTFENRYHIFHCVRRGSLTYLAVDETTALAAAFSEPKEPVQPKDYQTMIPDIIDSIKYTGDERYKGVCAYSPKDLFHYIFRIIMPRYGFAVREQQIQMATAIYNGLTQKKVTLCEAEVGSGKTMAYLVAGFAARMLDVSYRHMGHPVTITTSSIELQKAIVEKEIPALSKMLMDYGLISSPLTAVLRKGKEHYFCRRRYYEYIDSLFQNPMTHSRTISQLNALDLLNTALDMDKLPLTAHVKARICVKGSCHNCPRSGKCRYHAFLEEATSVHKFHFQITNHNLFLMSEKNRHLYTSVKSSLIPCNYCIVDEAHKLIEATADVFGAALSFSEVGDYLNAVKHNGGRSKKDRTQYKLHLKNAGNLNRKLLNLFSAYEFTSPEDVSEVEFQKTAVMEETLRKLISILDVIGRWSEMKNGASGNTAEPLIRKLSAFLSEQPCKYWISYDRTSGVKTLCCTPYEMKKSLCDVLWTKCNIHFAMTSGTMQGDRGFDYFKQELGITESVDRYLVSEFSCQSPFDYKNHTRLYISGSIPDPKANDPNYIPSLASEIVDLIRATGGHTAVLFTSYRVLNEVYEMVERIIKEYPLIKMTRSNKTAIDQFKKSGNGVLFASGSMWEGVDCAGDILSSVIIVRLPFPIRSHATDYERSKYRNPGAYVRQISIPKMVIKLRQGAGRLIRTETDTGVLAILDARAADGGAYRSQVLKVLSKFPRVGSIQEVADFMKKVKDESYWEGVHR